MGFEDRRSNEEEYKRYFEEIMRIIGEEIGGVVCVMSFRYL